MRFPFLISIFLFLAASVKGQYFNIPINGTPNTPINLPNISGLTDFSNNKFYSNSDNITVSGNPLVNSTTYSFPANQLNIPTFSDLAFDGTNYYLFSSNYNGGVIRWDFGTNMNNTPTAVSLGNLGNQQNEGIIIRKENNNWYGFLVSNGPTNRLTRIDFGTNLANLSPTTTPLGVLTLSWPHELTIIDEGGNWYGFVANRNTKVTRLDFGNSLTNAPTPFVYNNIDIVNPCNLRVIKDDGNWYLFSLNLFNGRIIRTDLGSNIANNNPTYTNLGEPHPNLGIARGLSFMQDCNGISGFVCDEAANLFDLSFAGDSITGAITGTPLTSTSLNNGYVNDFTPFWLNDTLNFILTLPLNWVGRAQVIPTTSPTAQGSTAFSPSFMYPTGGNYSISNLINVGDNGMRYQCSTIDIDSITNVYITKCPGDTIILSNNSVISVPGSYPDTLQNSMNQDSIIVINFSNYPTYNSTVAVNRCQGETYILPSSIIVSTSGTYADTFQTQNGCDSIINTNIQFNPTYSFTINDTICASTNYTLPGGGIVNTAGTYIDSFSTLNSCDSIYTTNLFVHPTFAFTVNDTICQGSNYTLPDNTVVSNSGTYTTTLLTNNNCDSVITTNLYVSPQSQSVQNVNLCDQTSYQLPSGAQVSTSGSYISTFISSTGCDSIITSNIVFNYTQTSSSSVTICSNSSYTLPDNTAVNQAGTYTSTIVGSNGCDSIITTILSVVEPPIIDLGEDVTICNNEAITLDVTTPNASYLWDDNSTSPVRTITERGYYFVTVTTPPCGPISDSLLVSSCECQVFIPNAFSPNGDNLNDKFSPFFNCNIEPASFLFEIYNRWGQQVFYTTLPNDAWDGTFKRQLQNIGTFYYVIKFINSDTKETEKYQGDVTLIK